MQVELILEHLSELHENLAMFPAAIRHPDFILGYMRLGEIRGSREANEEVLARIVPQIRPPIAQISTHPMPIPDGRYYAAGVDNWRWFVGFQSMLLSKGVELGPRFHESFASPGVYCVISFRNAVSHEELDVELSKIGRAMSFRQASLIVSEFGAGATNARRIRTFNFAIE